MSWSAFKQKLQLSQSSTLPLAFWLASFAIGTLAKGLAIGAPLVWYDLPPDLSLWAAGMAVAHLISVRDSGGARTVPVITHTHGPVSSVTMTYTTQLPADPRPSIGSMWGPIFAVLGWFACLLLSQYAQRIPAQAAPTMLQSFALVGSFVVAVGVSVMAIWLTSSVTTARPTTRPNAQGALPDEPTPTVSATSTEAEPLENTE